MYNSLNRHKKALIGPDWLAPGKKRKKDVSFYSFALYLLLVLQLFKAVNR